MNQIILGIDEVGRGAWAGPVVAGAVILPAIHTIPNLRDSKKIPIGERQRLSLVIRRQALDIGLGWVSALEVDNYGLSWAVKQSGLRAINHIKTSFDMIILDGSYKYLADQDNISRAIIKADDSVPAVSAAAIVAKVARDNFMAILHRQFPIYGFDTHVGYGTARHQYALGLNGICPWHRKSVKPISILELG